MPTVSAGARLCDQMGAGQTDVARMLEVHHLATELKSHIEPTRLDRRKASVALAEPGRLACRADIREVPFAPHGPIAGAIRPQEGFIVALPVLLDRSGGQNPPARELAQPADHAVMLRQCLLPAHGVHHLRIEYPWTERHLRQD